jgi:HlyD family secretion protein
MQEEQTGDEGSFGRIYRLGPDGNPQAVPVRLGATDGAYTEILRGDLQEGTAVIVGASRPGATEDPSGQGQNRRRPPRIF